MQADTLKAASKGCAAGRGPQPGQGMNRNLAVIEKTILHLD